MNPHDTLGCGSIQQKTENKAGIGREMPHKTSHLEDEKKIHEEKKRGGK
jgi:hypothetical protein